MQRSRIIKAILLLAAGSVLVNTWISCKESDEKPDQSEPSSGMGVCNFLSALNPLVNSHDLDPVKPVYTKEEFNYLIQKQIKYLPQYSNPSDALDTTDLKPILLKNAPEALKNFANVYEILYNLYENMEHGTKCTFNTLLSGEVSLVITNSTPAESNSKVLGRFEPHPKRIVFFAGLKQTQEALTNISLVTEHFRFILQELVHASDKAQYIFKYNAEFGQDEILHVFSQELASIRLAKNKNGEIYFINATAKNDLNLENFLKIKSTTEPFTIPMKAEMDILQSQLESLWDQLVTEMEQDTKEQIKIREEISKTMARFDFLENEIIQLEKNFSAKLDPDIGNEFSAYTLLDSNQVKNMTKIKGEVIEHLWDSILKVKRNYFHKKDNYLLEYHARLPFMDLTTHLFPLTTSLIQQKAAKAGIKSDCPFGLFGFVEKNTIATKPESNTGDILSTCLAITTVLAVLATATHGLQKIHALHETEEHGEEKNITPESTRPKPTTP